MDRNASPGNLSQPSLASMWGRTRNALWKGFLSFSLGSDHKKAPRWWAQTTHLHLIWVPWAGSVPSITVTPECILQSHQNTDKERLFKNFFDSHLPMPKSLADCQQIYCPMSINLILFALTYQTYYPTTAQATFSFCLTTHRAVSLCSSFSLADP